MFGWNSQVLTSQWLLKWLFIETKNRFYRKVLEIVLGETGRMLVEVTCMVKAYLQCHLGQFVFG